MKNLIARGFGVSCIAAAAIALTACGDREAESETDVSEAEVQTELPESVVSDEQLQATADAAANLAATPPVAAVPVPAQNGMTVNKGMPKAADNEMEPDGM